MSGRRPRTSSRDEPPRKQRKLRHSFQVPQVNRNMDKHKQEEAVEERWPNWSELLPEVLELIMARMHIGDRIQSSRVCKQWRSSAVRITPKSQPRSYGSPCCVRLLDDSKRCMITDPLRGVSSIIDTPGLPHGAVIRFSGYGWLMLAPCSTSGSDPILFNPLTRSIIGLPKLATQEYYTVFGFSSSPTSSDCVVTAMSTKTHSTNICYCHPGEKEWTSLHVRHYKKEFRAFKNPVFFKNRVYVWSDQGCDVGVYDLSAGVLTNVIKGGPHMNFRSDNLNFVQIDNKLMSVCINVDESIHIYELDEWGNEWILLKTIGERLVFSSAVNSMFMKVASAREFSEKIHVIYGKKICSYSCKLFYQLQTIKKYEDAAQHNISFTRWGACWIELMP